MADRLCLLVCESLEREVKAVIESEEFDDVVVRAFPAHCGRPQTGWDAWRGIIQAGEQDCSQVYLLGGSCIVGLQAPPDELKHCRLRKMDGCYSMFAGKETIEAYLKTGAYLLTPGWLAHWKRHIGEWGFDQATAREFFAESAARLVLLDTGVDAASADCLAEFADFVGLPFKSVPVGLDFSRLFLAKIVLEWRLENERIKSAVALSNANRQLADNAMVFDLIGSLPGTMTEAEAIENVFELFDMLCAPARLAYIPFDGGQPGNALSRPAELSVGESIPARLAGFREDYAWTDSGNGFVLRISHQNETLGVLEIEGLAFPQHKQHYLNLALAVVQVCGLAIANARAYQELERLVEELEESLDHRKRAEETLQERNRDLDLLNRVSQTLTATLDPQEVTERLMKALTQTIGAEGSSVWMWDEEQPGGLVCHGAAYPGLKRSLIGLRLSPGEGIAGWVAHNGTCAIVPRVSDDPRFTPVIDAQSGFHTVCVLAVPLRVHDKVIGVLEAVNKVSGDFDAHDGALLETLASSAAIAIENARLVENLLQQTDELSARNEELDAFAHTVAHDLKNPLSMLIGFADLLRDARAAMTDEDQRACYAGIARVAYKMDSIVKELLLLAQVRQVEVGAKPLDMAGILAEVQQRLAPMIAEYQAEVVLPSVWPAAVGYAPWVEEVWVNYLSNALKYGGRPPRVQVGADLPLADEGEGGGMVRFWVRDNGPGITPEDQARLFVPFTRLSQARVGGHGLGLSIVRRIVEKLGGQVWVESQVGQGSVFCFTLPGASPLGIAPCGSG